MSYIADNTTRAEFLAERKIRSRQVAQVALNQFDIFCKSQYEKDGNTIIKDIKDSGIADKAYTIMNQFCMWLGEDHPKLQVIMGKSSRPMRKRQPMTIRGYLVVLKAYFEEFGGIEINDRRFKKRVRQQKRINHDPEPFTHEEIRLLCDTASPEKKLLYMVLKDTAMRVGEALHLYKEDIDLTTNPISINIRAETTKTSTARAVHITPETAPMLINKIKNTQDGKKIFATNKDHLKAVSNETLMMTFYRKKIGGAFLEKYSHNGRHKKNIHSLRAFAITQIADIHGEEFAHGYAGHTKYLGQYIRRNDKIPEMIKRCAPKLMIYESIVVVDQDERVKKLEEEQQKSRLDMMALTNILSQLADIKADSVRKDLEIKQLQSMLENKESSSIPSTS